MVSNILVFLACLCTVKRHGNVCFKNRFQVLATLSFVCCVCNWGSGVVWSILSLYCTGGDHHKAQTGGAIWPSLRPSPGASEAKVWGEGGLGPLYDGCLLEVDRAKPQWTDPLMVPHSEEMDERSPNNTHDNMLMHACRHTNTH